MSGLPFGRYEISSTLSISKHQVVGPLESDMQASYHQATHNEYLTAHPSWRASVAVDGYNTSDAARYHADKR